MGTRTRVLAAAGLLTAALALAGCGDDEAAAPPDGGPLVSGAPTTVGPSPSLPLPSGTSTHTDPADPGGDGTEEPTGPPPPTDPGDDGDTTGVGVFEGTWSFTAAGGDVDQEWTVGSGGNVHVDPGIEGQPDGEGSITADGDGFLVRITFQRPEKTTKVSYLLTEGPDDDHWDAEGTDGGPGGELVRE